VTDIGVLKVPGNPPATQSGFRPHAVGRGVGSLLLLVWLRTGCADAAFELHQVSPGVFVHYGVHEIVSPSNAGDIANVGFIVGAKAVAVVDPGGSYRLGRALRRAVGAITDLPIRYVILTHVHPDHMFGVAAFTDPGVEIIGHARLEQALARRGQFYLDRFRPVLGEALRGARVLAPTIKVSSSTDIDLGQRRLTLTAHPTAHTDHDLTVFDHKTKTLWASDLIFRERIPSVDGSVLGWIEVMRQLRAVDADRVVPGHGRAGPWPQAGEDQRRYLNTLATEVRQLIDRRVPMQEAMSLAADSERGKWLLFEEYHPSNVSRCYAELEWE
jgi:quinoprotein relay system zinc metallohydrolase 2